MAILAMTRFGRESAKSLETGEVFKCHVGLLTTDRAQRMSSPLPSILMNGLTGNVRIDILTVGMEGREMSNSSVVSTKGQVTVPKEIRKRLGLRVGDRVEFVARGHETHSTGSS